MMGGGFTLEWRTEEKVPGTLFFREELMVIMMDDGDDEEYGYEEECDYDEWTCAGSNLLDPVALKRYPMVTGADSRQVRALLARPHRAAG